MLTFRKLGPKQVAARLRESLKIVTEQQKNFADINQVALLVILEEDIKTLLDEYRLIKNGNPRHPSVLKSFYQRAFHVFEETQSYRGKSTMNPPPAKTPLSALSRKAVSAKGVKDKASLNIK